MNATFEFVKQNFKSLFRTLIYIVGPPALIASLLLSSVMGDYFKAVFGMMGGGLGFGDLFTFDLILKICLAIIIATVTGVITLSTVNNYVILYREKRSNQIEVEEVWERVKKTFMMYFWTVIGWVVLAFIVYVALVIPVVIFSGFSTGLGILFVFAVIVVLFYLLIATSLVFVVRGFETRGFFESFGRSIQLIRGKWWSTFGLYVIFYLIITIISSVFFVPWYMTRAVTSLHDVSEGRSVTDTGFDWFGTLSISIQYLVSYLMGVLPQIALIFQYFNLVERKESRGLMEKMESLGSSSPAKPDKTEEHY